MEAEDYIDEKVDSSDEEDNPGNIELEIEDPI